MKLENGTISREELTLTWIRKTYNKKAKIEAAKKDTTICMIIDKALEDYFTK